MTEDIGILFVEDDADMRQACLSMFRKDGFHVAGVATAAEALATMDGGTRFDIVVTDLRLPGMSGLDLLRAIKKRNRSIEVVLMTGYGTVRSAVEAMKVGASDYLTKPFDMDELLVIVRRLVRLRNLEVEVERLRTELKNRHRFGNIVGRGPKMREVFGLTRAAADSDAPVLIEGESGSGKEVIARAIHYEGKRSAGPFVPVNCSALPAELLESELFGHCRGAFTGALQDAPGLFQSAQGGTILLDEITEMPLEAQAKLLRVLEDKRVRPVGAVQSVAVDVRVVAATNRPLATSVRAGTLREDLYYRLGVIVVSVPPLRERTGDIPALAMHFVEQFNNRSSTAVIEGFTAEALDALCAYPWPGNVRELRNVIEGLYALGHRGRIERSDLPHGIRDGEQVAQPDPAAPAVLTLQQAERNLVEAALRTAKGNKSEAARMLGISRTRLYHLIRLYRIRL